MTALVTLAIPLLGQELSGALVSLFVLFLFFEITVVGSFPLLTEIVPSSRGLVMSFVIAAGSLGRTLGSLLGPFLWSRGGLGLNAVVSALILGSAIFVLARWVHEARDETTEQVGEAV